MSRTIKYDERANIYDIEYIDRDDHNMLAYYVNEANRILEIPCGSGRNIDIYKNTNALVTMVDIEPNMVQITKEKIKDYMNVRCLIGDIQNLRIIEQFDLIIIAKEAFQMFTSRYDAKRILNQLTTHLTDKGLIYIDVFEYGKQPYYDFKPLYYEYESLNKDFRLNWTRGNLTRWSKLVYKDKILDITYKYLFHKTGYEIYSHLQMQDYSFKEIITLCKECNLNVLHIYGNYDFTDYDFSYNRMILILSNS